MLASLILLGAGTACAETAAWRSSYFDGTTFREGAPQKTTAVFSRDGSFPVIQVTGNTPSSVNLPKGTGAAVVFCYIQSSGGKLSSQSGSFPAAGAVVEFRERDRRIAIRTDDSGYAVVALPSGDYEISVQGMKKKVKLEKGKTVLLPIRVGKRMVD